MTKVEFNFRGLMSPVFTPFNNDCSRSVNYGAIEPYAKDLHDKGVFAVLINGTAGEGVSLTTDERKKIAELWKLACTKYNMTLMVQIGGTSYNNVVELAKHAEELKVDAVLTLPELYFKPSTEEDCVVYIKNISKHCPTLPILYYHIPQFSGVSLNMARLANLAEQSIPNFVGIKFSSGDLDQGASCLKPGRVIFLGSPKVTTGALALGFDSSIMTTLNICPELPIKIYQLIKENRLKEAQEVQNQLSRRVNEILNRGQLVSAMKYEFNQVNPHINAGPPREPLKHII